MHLQLIYSETGSNELQMPENLTDHRVNTVTQIDIKGQFENARK